MTCSQSVKGFLSATASLAKKTCHEKASSAYLLTDNHLVESITQLFTPTIHVLSTPNNIVLRNCDNLIYSQGFCRKTRFPFGLKYFSLVSNDGLISYKSTYYILDIPT